jgi:hypothetical protein
LFLGETVNAIGVLSTRHCKHSRPFEIDSVGNYLFSFVIVCSRLLGRLKPSLHGSGISGPATEYQKDMYIYARGKEQHIFPCQHGLRIAAGALLNPQ